MSQGTDSFLAPYKIQPTIKHTHIWAAQEGLRQLHRENVLLREDDNLGGLRFDDPGHL